MSATDHKPLHPLGAAGLVALCAGLLAWLWLGEWRWGATSLLALVLLAAIGAAMDRRKGGAR